MRKIVLNKEWNTSTIFEWNTFFGWSAELVQDNFEILDIEYTNGNTEWKKIE